MINRFVTSWFVALVFPLVLLAIMFGSLAGIVDAGKPLTSTNMVHVGLYAGTLLTLGVNLGIKISSKMFMPVIHALTLKHIELLNQLKEGNDSCTNTQQ